MEDFFTPTKLADYGLLIKHIFQSGGIAKGLWRIPFYAPGHIRSDRICYHPLTLYGP